MSIRTVPTTHKVDFICDRANFSIGQNPANLKHQVITESSLHPLKGSRQRSFFRFNVQFGKVGKFLSLTCCLMTSCMDGETALHAACAVSFSLFMVRHEQEE